MRPETIKLLEDNIEEKFHCIEIGNDFLDMTPKAQAAAAKIDKWDYIILKNCCRAKGTINREKAINRMGENICKLYI